MTRKFSFYPFYLQELVDVNVRCSTSGHREVTALMLAASCGNEAISTALLDRGADINARDKEGWTALFHATNGNHANLGRCQKKKFLKKKLLAFTPSPQKEMSTYF